jgi:dihydroorotase
MVEDVEIQGGTIVQVAPNLADPIGRSPGQEIIDAQGLILLPGVIDPQVHFRNPGLEHKEDSFTVSCACAQGRVTSLLETANTHLLTTNQAALHD